MVEQHKFLRVRLEVNLVLQVRLREDQEMMTQQGARDDQGQESMAVAVDDLCQFLPGGSGNLALEVAGDAVQHIRMPRPRAGTAQRVKEDRLVCIQQFRGGLALQIGHDLPKGAEMGEAVGHDLAFEVCLDGRVYMLPERELPAILVTTRVRPPCPASDD